MTPHPIPRSRDRQLAVVVGGGTDALALVEPVLNDRAYDVEFVDPADEPYGTVLAVKPDIVIVSLNLDDEAGFRFLTMLRLDPNTAEIPVLSCVSEGNTPSHGLTEIDHGLSRLPAVVPSRAQRH